MTKIWTAGYENVGQSDFIDALSNAGVQTVIDVREIANSRRAGFAKKALSEGLAAAGIGYVHLKALGTPKAGRDANRRGDMATFHRIYDEALEQPAAQLALREAADIARGARACLLCLEADWQHCHRAKIAARLEREHGLKAVHLAMG